MNGEDMANAYVLSLNWCNCCEESLDLSQGICYLGLSKNVFDLKLTQDDHFTVHE